MKRAIIVPNYRKEESVEFSKKAIELLEKNGYRAVVLKEDEEPTGTADIALVLGGDGTLLRACKKMYLYDIPMLGINFGHLGYLTECNPDDAISTIQSVIKGEYVEEHRLLLSGELVRNGEKITEFVGMNEASLFRSTYRKAFIIEVFVNGIHTESVYGDGLVIATPTGSTSYNLSLGGPVLPPSACNMVLTPASPIFFPRASLVIDGNDELELRIKLSSVTQGVPLIEVDGDFSFELKDGDIIKIKRHDKFAKTIKVNNVSFYQTLRKKLSKAIFDI